MRLGHTVLRYTTVTSTNDLAWQHAGNEENHGLVIVAEEQTQGRGRRGDAWLAPSGSALLLSILLKPPSNCRKAAKLTLWAGLVVCHVLKEHLGLAPQIKWPNDVLSSGKKLCGILVEQRGEWVVVGVGLNVSLPTAWLQSTELTQAGSVTEFTARSIDLEQLLQWLLTEWDLRFAEMVADNDSTLLDWWASYSGLVGQQVVLEVNGAQLIGRLISLDWDQVLVETNGITQRHIPESITRLQLAR